MHGFIWHNRAQSSLPQRPSAPTVSLWWPFPGFLVLGSLWLTGTIPIIAWAVMWPLGSSCILRFISNIEWKVSLLRERKFFTSKWASRSRVLSLVLEILVILCLGRPCMGSVYKDFPSGDFWETFGYQMSTLGNKTSAYRYQQYTIFTLKCCTKTNRVSLNFREQIRQGLEELQKVLPGGDTYMHEGFVRVILRQF